MFGDHFYHATMRKSVAVFGTLFNNLKVARKSANGGLLNQVRVPLAYGPKQKFLARLDQETGFDAPMAIKLPRMAFEMTSITLDATQKLPKRNKIVENHASDVTKKKTIKHYTSYDIGMSLYIMAKNQDDGLQIVEQILPYFQPEYSVTITPVDSFSHKQDVQVILQSVNIDDQYEGDFTERRVLIYQLDFIMKMKFYGPTGDQGIIREVKLDFKDKDNTSSIFEEMDLTINPTTAGPGDTYNVVTTITSGDASNTVTPGTSTETTISYSLYVQAKTGAGETGNAFFYNNQQAPAFNLIRGRSYSFSYPAAHPFKISTTSDGTHNGGSEYNSGVTVSNNVLTFLVPDDAPDTLYYYCSNHSAMGGQINVTG